MRCTGAPLGAIVALGEASVSGEESTLRRFFGDEDLVTDIEDSLVRRERLERCSSKANLAASASSPARVWSPDLGIRAASDRVRRPAVSSSGGEE